MRYDTRGCLILPEETLIISKKTLSYKSPTIFKVNTADNTVINVYNFNTADNTVINVWVLETEITFFIADIF